MISSVTALSIFSSQIVVLELERIGFEPMIVMTGLCVIGFFATRTLPETVGMPLKDEIE